MLIQEVSFGKMVIDGQVYTHDLMIVPEDGIRSPWIRKQGHLLVLADLDEMHPVSLQHLVVGSGAYGRMEVDKAVGAFFRKRVVQVEILKTAPAADLFNDLCRNPAIDAKGIGACFHLTC